MNIEQTPIFRKSYKKLRENQLASVNDAIRHIMANPDAGEDKRGDLTGVLVYKFRIHDQQLLLAYEYDENHILLLAIGVHENFYRDLKKGK